MCELPPAATVGYMRAADTAALRAARASAALPLDAAARAAGVAPRRLAARLRSTRRGSRCADMTAAAVAAGAASRRAAALAHPACPPALRRAAARDKVRTARDAARGVPGWASRAGVGSVPSRAHMARVAADPSSYDSLPDKIAALVSYPGCPPVMLRRLPIHYSMHNPACPPDVLARLSLSADRYDGERTARHPNCPPGRAEAARRRRRLRCQPSRCEQPGLPTAGTPGSPLRPLRTTAPTRQHHRRTSPTG